MDELEISGKRYISSRRAAKEHRYHSDYIGQLIRGGKVVGEKVGRSWYVEAQSLEAYLRGEISKGEISTPAVEEKIALEPEPLQDPALEEKIEEKIEEPVSEPETPSIKITPAAATEVVRKEEEHRVAIHIAKPEPLKKGLTYMADDSPLLPEIRKDTVRHNMQSGEHVPTVQTKISRPRRSFSALGLGALGVLSFAIVVGAASFLSYTSIVEGENASAAVTLGYWK